ncbi:uncharacterized protein LOC123865435 [Maniola jurtina]|uniref:uncharacterized protein LOC123865435 n=1 Tax=Maniola jurtina TaxID=191418 RepID=UPI001E68E626|nr:uncharacterized protein LOC123865435 [Maniola jurtina]XP_045762411.1 uncharacterized protein LOC123865435 [Maniola jurtina]
MDPTVYLLVLGVSIASARHTLNANRYLVPTQSDPNHSFKDQYSAQDVERRDIDYASNVNTNRKAYSGDAYRNQRQHNVEHSYVTESDHVALISEKVDSSNNIGNDANEFKLRTNAYPTKRLENTEFTTESVDERRQRGYTHTEQQNVQGRYDEGEFGTRENSKIQDNHQRSILNPRANHQRSLNMDREMRFIPHQTQANENSEVSSSITNIRNDNDKTNQGSTTQRGAPVENKNWVPETVTVNVRPIEHSSTNKIPTGSRGVDGRVPKEKDEEEVPWVWGTEPATRASTTDVNDLDDRAAFEGSKCPTGYVRVNGICVEKE